MNSLLCDTHTQVRKFLRNNGNVGKNFLSKYLMPKNNVTTMTRGSIEQTNLPYWIFDHQKNALLRELCTGQLCNTLEAFNMRNTNKIGTHLLEKYIKKIYIYISRKFFEKKSNKNFGQKFEKNKSSNLNYCTNDNDDDESLLELASLTVEKVCINPNANVKNCPKNDEKIIKKLNSKKDEFAQRLHVRFLSLYIFFKFS